jgi:hypothetical protein
MPGGRFTLAPGGHAPWLDDADSRLDRRRLLRVAGIRKLGAATPTLRLWSTSWREPDA